MFCSRLALSLPQVVTFGNGATITYYYAADGTKVRTVHVVNGATTQTDYCGNVIYENGVQKLLQTEEGYVDLSNPNTYHYYLKDHQGNNRVVIDGSGTVKETNHYYPFGGLFASSTIQPFKYNDKEFDSKNGLNWYDYGARHYDAALGRWHVVDPSAENYYSIAPYIYCDNNPVGKIDPNGKDYWSTNDPEEIKRMLSHLVSLPSKQGNIFEYFDFSNWNHTTDNDFIANLTFNDETNKFYINYGSVINNEVVITGITIDAVRTSNTGASVIGSTGRWYQKSSGKLNNIYPEVAFLSPWRNSIRSMLKKLFTPKINTSLINTFNAKAAHNVKIKGFKESKEFGYIHGQKVFEYNGKYYSKDIDGHNGGVWKVFEKVNGKLRRIGTADAELNIFKK